eukprot:3929176-Prymnesium_polylepis.1
MHAPVRHTPLSLCLVDMELDLPPEMVAAIVTHLSPTATGRAAAIARAWQNAARAKLASMRLPITRDAVITDTCDAPFSQPVGITVGDGVLYVSDLDTPIDIGSIHQFDAETHLPCSTLDEQPSGSAALAWGLDLGESADGDECIYWSGYCVGRVYAADAEDGSI